MCELYITVGFFSVSSIPDNSDPRERMIAIARHYCSAFHAARKVLIKYIYTQYTQLWLLSCSIDLHAIAVDFGIIPTW